MGLGIGVQPTQPASNHIVGFNNTKGKNRGRGSWRSSTNGPKFLLVTFCFGDTKQNQGPAAHQDLKASRAACRVNALL
jgi:hypothetical protein